jgi:hypothetical protein
MLWRILVSLSVLGLAGLPAVGCGRVASFPEAKEVSFTVPTAFARRLSSICVDFCDLDDVARGSDVSGDELALVLGTRGGETA